MRPIVVTCGPYTAPSATNIRTASSVTSGAVTLNGSLVSSSVATLDTQRRVLFTSAGNDSGITFTITGTNASNDVISETLTGGNTTSVYTVLSYKTVTAVTASGASAGDVSIGTNGVADSTWVRLDDWALPNVSIQSVVSGTINYTIQQTYDDVNSPAGTITASSVTWSTLVAAAAATAITNAAYQPVFVRVLVNSNTNPATVTTTFLQTGVVPQ